MVSIAKTCREEDCDRDASVRGLCRNHYRKQLVGSMPGYGSWQHMIQRCVNPNDNRYPTHGGRGVTVCERWRKSYSNFIADMGLPPSSRHSIDRIDNDGNYEPGNCRWATPLQQGLNKSLSTRNISGYRGVTRNSKGTKWRADVSRLAIDKYFLGNFDDAKEAAWMYDQFAFQIWGEDVRLNFDYYPVPCQNQY